MKRTIRYILSLLLLMCLGVGETWGQTTDYSGTYYIRNMQKTDAYWYLVPCMGGGYYNGNEDTPYLTTYQTNQDMNSLWRLEKVTIDGTDYYRIIHNATGLYVTFNEAVLDYSSTTSNAARLRLHLEAFDLPTDATLFYIQPHTSNGNIAIRPKDGYDTVNNYYWWDIGGNNQGNYWNNDYKGALGLWNKLTEVNNACRWNLITANPTCATPVITYNESAGSISLSYPIADDDGVTIYYTTDGSKPTSSSSTYSAAFSATGVKMVRAIAVKTGYDNSAEAKLYSPTQPWLFKTTDDANVSYYMIPPTDDDRTTDLNVTTSNVPNERMQWYLKPAALRTGVQYYYFVNAVTGKYAYCNVDVSKPNALLMKALGEDDTESDRYMFRIIDYGTYLNIVPKHVARLIPSSNNKNCLRKANATDHTNPIGLYQDDGGLSRWLAIAAPDDPRTLSALPEAMVTEGTNAVAFKIRNATQSNGNDYFVCPPTTPTGSATASATGDYLEWYFLPAEDNDTWGTYYYLRNAAGDYLYFDGTTYNDNNNKFYVNSTVTAGNEDKFKFMVLRTANTTYSGTWHIVPKQIRHNNNQTQIALNRNNTTLKTQGSRNAGASCWYLDEQAGFVAKPIITYDPATNKIALACTTPGAAIYYTTNGEDATTSSTPYSEPFPVAAGVTTIKAVASKGGATTTVSTYTIAFQTTVGTDERPYLLRNNNNAWTGDVPFFYMIPDSRNAKANTTPIPMDRMEWLIKDGGVIDGVQHYIIVDKVTNEYLYYSGTGDALDLNSSYDATNNGFRFRIVPYPATGTPTGYNIIPYGLTSGKRFVHKSSANTSDQPVYLDGSNSGASSLWNFVMKSDLDLSVPFSASDESAANYSYYKIKSKRTTDGGFYIMAYASGEKANVSNSTAEEDVRKMNFYLKSAGTDGWAQFYHIIDAETGRYLYCNATQANTYNVNSGDQLFFSMSTSNDDRSQYVVVKSPFEGNYYIVPKVFIHTQWNNYSSLVNKEDKYLKTDMNRGVVGPTWQFEASAFTCSPPVITYSNAAGGYVMTSSTSGSKIYYTTNGEDPTPSNSTPYTGAIPVPDDPTTLKAVAVRNTSDFSDASAVTTLEIVKVAAPVFQNNGNSVSITCATEGATIYYTTDDSTPTTASTSYSRTLTDDISGKTIKAIAVKQGHITSDVAISEVITLGCAQPVIRRGSGNNFVITCSYPSEGVTIYYTTDGSTPTTSSTQYTLATEVPFTGSSVTVKAIAVAEGYANSPVSEKTITEDMEGEGTQENPYLIASAGDFDKFIAKVNDTEGGGASAHYRVTYDFTVNSNSDPITTPFSGTFDGGYFVISDLSQPLFNTVNGGVVKNVSLKGVAISSSADYVGAIAGIAQGYSRIYNCGILPNDATFPAGTHPTVTGGTCAGGIVGKLDGDSRVINCYSYADVSASTYAAGIVGQNTYASTAEVSGGKYTKLKTAVVNCMFYGNITGGSNQYGVYGGSLITNAAATGISSYNYYRSGSTFTTGEPTAYNCSFPADERYLTQVEFHRSLLNSNRELCGWWVGSDVAPSTMTTAEVQAIPKDASLMYKWVVDPNLAPYPILKPFGKYPSIINTNTGTPWFDRTTAAPFEGKQLGTLSVIIKSGGSASDQHLFIPITDMDSLHYDFGYRKVQLPYYNTVFGNPDGATWQEKYAGNYTDQVVTGWKITNVSGGTQGSFVADWQDGYNFADRKCTNKDLYSVSGRVFAQGGYYYVPDDVTEITIEAYWGKAIYVRNDGGYYDRVNVTSGNTGAAFAPTGTRDNNVNGATIQTTSIKETLTAANIDEKKTVYDYALVLVGNVQESVGKSDVVHKTQDTRGFTIMSVDLDFDEEPDYCLEWQLGKEMTRQVIAPIRFDFLPVVELGIAGKLHNSKDFYSLGCYRSKGHFEVTETAFIRFGQFEFELGTRDDGPIILNGGIYDQYSRGRNGETNQHINYVILGGHIVMPSFTPGAHVNSAATYQTRHCAVNALGGDFTSFYLTGGYNEKIKPFEDNPHCYIDGGRFGTIAAAYKEGIAGNVTWRINHALIGEFYGGGVMAQATGDTYKIVKGSIDVVINNSIVGKYCGGPKFGDMVDGKTVTTSASNTVFNQFFGAGNGGTNYVQYANTDGTGVPVTDWSSTINSNYTPGKYRNKDQGYHADYDIEVINYSTGDGNGKFVNRSYYYSAQFATTNTGNVTSTLTDCTINTNFYGGGFLGGVAGNITSTLNNCNVKGAVFGAGYSASAGTVSIGNNDKNPPVVNTYTGMIKPQTGGTSTTYYWTHDKGTTSSPITAATEADPHNYFYTEIPLNNLGEVSGNVKLTIEGSKSIECKKVKTDDSGNPIYDEHGKIQYDGTRPDGVFGGGDESKVKGNIIVNLKGNVEVNGNVFGGGNNGEVGGSTEVNILLE